LVSKKPLFKYPVKFHKALQAILQGFFFARLALAITLRLSKKAMSNFNSKKAKKLLNDPAYRLYAEVANMYDTQIKSGINPLNEKIGIYMREYMKAQRLMQPDRDFYPDANSTLRVTYGNVKGYTAKDAVYYTYQTTDEGIEQKYIAGDEDFDMPASLIALFEKNNFGSTAAGFRSRCVFWFPFLSKVLWR